MASNSKAARQTNATLTAIFAEVGSSYGYEEVSAEFAAFRDFKIKWTRSTRWISFEISDYFNDTPSAILKAMADTVFKKIKGDMSSGYTPAVIRHLTSKTFLRKNQPTYIKRVRGAEQIRDGEIVQAYLSLVDNGLVEEIPGIAFLEAAPGRSNKASMSSVLFRTVVVPEQTVDLGADTLRYAVFRAVVKIETGFQPTEERRQAAMERIANYPGAAKAERELAAAGLYLD